MFVCLLVCLLFIGHTTLILSTLRRCLRVLRSESSQAVAGGPARAAGKRMHSAESTRAHAVQLLNEKIGALMPFKNKTVRARACCRIRNCRDFQKKGKKKTNMPLPKFSLQFAFSWSVYFSNRIESYLIFGRSRPWSARKYNKTASPVASLPDFSFPFNQGGESQRAEQGVVKYFTTPWC